MKTIGSWGVILHESKRTWDLTVNTVRPLSHGYEGLAARASTLHLAKAANRLWWNLAQVTSVLSKPTLTGGSDWMNPPYKSKSQACG